MIAGVVAARFGVGGGRVVHVVLMCVRECASPRPTRGVLAKLIPALAVSSRRERNEQAIQDFLANNP